MGTWGVLAEIVVFALSPRFVLPPSVLVVIGGLSAIARWLITAQDLSVVVLSVAQLAHGLTQVGAMGLLVRHVPVHTMARGQGNFAASTGIVTSGATILSGAVYARYGQGVYYIMAAMALLGAGCNVACAAPARRSSPQRGFRWIDHAAVVAKSPVTVAR